MRIRALALLGAFSLACHLGDLQSFVCRSDKTQFKLTSLSLGSAEQDSPVAIGFDRKNRVIHTVQPTVTISEGNIFGIISFKVHDIDQGFQLTRLPSSMATKGAIVQIRSMALSDEQVVLGGQQIDGSNKAVLLFGNAPMSPVTVFSSVEVRDSGSCSSVWARSRAVAAVCGGQLYVWSDWDAAQPNKEPRRLREPTNPTDGRPIPVTLVSVTSDGAQIAVGGNHGVVCHGRMDGEAPLQCEQVAAEEVIFQGGWINGSGAIHIVGTQGTTVRREPGELAAWNRYDVLADRGGWNFKKIGSLGPCQPLIVGQDALQTHGILLRETNPGIWEQEQVPATDLTDFAGDDRDVFLLGVKDKTPLLWHRPDSPRANGRTAAERSS